MATVTWEIQQCDTPSGPKDRWKKTLSGGHKITTRHCQSPNGSLIAHNQQKRSHGSGSAFRSHRSRNWYCKLSPLRSEVVLNTLRKVITVIYVFTSHYSLRPDLYVWNCAKESYISISIISLELAPYSKCRNVCRRFAGAQIRRLLLL